MGVSLILNEFCRLSYLYGNVWQSVGRIIKWILGVKGFFWVFLGFFSFSDKSKESEQRKHRKVNKNPEENLVCLMIEKTRVSYSRSVLVLHLISLNASIFNNSLYEVICKIKRRTARHSILVLLLYLFIVLFRQSCHLITRSLKTDAKCYFNNIV